MLTTRPRGTNDILPGEVEKWRHVEGAIHDICRRYGYEEIRPPLFEHTEIFERGVGEATDIVEKEMYTFTDRAGRRITLRPEFTAGVVRSYLENKLYAQPQPSKLYSIGPAFRYERPQAGRYRQFHQWNVEAFGSQNPAVDAEVILIGLDLAGELGLEGLTVSLNSLGCPNCRPAYREMLVDFYRDKLGGLCEDCRKRYVRNPLRLIDCKVETCRELARGVPRMADALCPECREHFASVQEYLRARGVPYDVDPGIVRGLDYYTKTVFEVKYPPLGAQDTVWGGGRYDGLIETLGGPPTPGVGFAMGLERMIMTLGLVGTEFPARPPVDAFIACLGEDAFREGVNLVYRLRAAGLAADIDYLGRSLKGQLKYADKLRSRYVVILGTEELAKGAATVRDMASGEQLNIALDTIVSALNLRLGRE